MNKPSPPPGFWGRAAAWFAAQGITVERVLTDNGSCYRSGHWHRARDNVPGFHS